MAANGVSSASIRVVMAAPRFDRWVAQACRIIPSMRRNQTKSEVGMALRLRGVARRLILPKNKQQIEHQIHNGGAAMPAFGDVLQPDEIKDLVDFLHAKRKTPKTAATATPSR